MRLAAGIALLLVSSCGLFRDESDDPQALPDGNTVQVCAMTRLDWRNLVSTIDRACQQPEDCVAIGAVTTCDCTVPLAANCSGEPVSRRGVAAVEERLSAIVAAWSIFDCRSNDDLGRVCDCAPTSATCVNNRCVDAPPPSCFPPPSPDAGVVSPSATSSPGW